MQWPEADVLQRWNPRRPPWLWLHRQPPLWAFWRRRFVRAHGGLYWLGVHPNDGLCFLPQGLYVRCSIERAVRYSAGVRMDLHIVDSYTGQVVFLFPKGL